MFREQELRKVHEDIIDASDRLAYVLRNRTPDSSVYSINLYLHDIDLCIKRLEFLREDVKIIKDDIELHEQAEKLESPIRRFLQMLTS